MSLSDALADKATPRERGTVEVGPDGGEFKNATVQGRLDGDWSRIFDLFGLDPDEFEVIDDTVRMSTWQQSKRTESGDRDVAQLYSYSARFRRVTREMVSEETRKTWRKALLKSKFERNVDQRDGGGTYVALVADPQLGKKGTDEAIENWRRGLSAHVDQARRLGVAGFHIAFMGDETEGVCNSYRNQVHTIEMNQSQQLETDFDLRVWSVKEALTIGVPVSVSSVISNHGENWVRNAGKDPVTTNSDNASTHTARLVQKFFAELEQYGVPAVEWHIGNGHPAVTLTLDGVKCYFTHGHIEKGRGTSTETRTRAAIERQILGNTADLGDVRLYFAAHYHHAYYQEFEGRTLFGCPALEAKGSSEYMSEQFGVWSDPGMLGLVVTDQNARGWAHKNIF